MILDIKDLKKVLKECDKNTFTRKEFFNGPYVSKIFRSIPHFCLLHHLYHLAYCENISITQIDHLMNRITVLEKHNFKILILFYELDYDILYNSYNCCLVKLVKYDLTLLWDYGKWNIIK